MLLLPRSARNAPPAALSRALPRDNPASLLRCASRASSRRSAPSILGSPKFDRYVATRFLPDSNFHGHRPTVLIWPPPLWSLCPCFGYLSLCQVHPFLQTMLTTVCPLVPHRSCMLVAPTRTTHSKFVDQVHILSTASSYPRHRCPARHFGWNQLPDSSFGLSPLYPSSVIELNIRTT